VLTTVADIAAWFDGEVIGERSVPIVRVAKIEEAGEGDLTFLANPKYEKYLASTRAAAVLVSRSFRAPAGDVTPSPVLIKVDDPYAAFLQALKRLMPSLDPFPEGIHPSAVIAPSARLGEEVRIGPTVVIGDGVIVGDRTRIGAGCVIGPEAVLGAETVLYPRVVVYHQCRIGDRVIVHSGTVIGSDGFGFAPRNDGTYEKIPQLGIVVIEDDVEIGSNCSVDRATIGETLIRRGTKLDNLIQIAHNVVIGEHTVIAAQAGISGSTRIGSHCMIAGQVGIAGHLEIADRTVIMAQSGIPKSVTKPGQTLFGYPAKEHGRAFRIEAVLRSLPELAAQVRSLEEQVRALSEKLKAQH
jgi:UDP-3-O-[3-hydroxymyristoyl] glucosamine N-acyltransferase